MAKFTPSKHQKDIFNFILTDNRNAVISAVAGSGKTTTVLHMAKELCKESILLLTYNARLKFFSFLLKNLK